MGNILNSVGNSLSSFTWTNIGTALLVVFVMFIMIIIFAVIFFIMWWKGYNLVTHIYEPLGQINLTDKEIEEIKKQAKKGDQSLLKEKKIRFDVIKHRKTHGKHDTIKGTPYFFTFMPHRKIEPIPMELMFNDGIHLLRISRELFIPIPKPNTIISVAENVSISVSEHNKWVTWNNLMSERINQKYRDLDAQKKMVVTGIAIIAGVVIVGCVILWFIYNSVNKGFSAAEKFNVVADSLLGNKNRPV